MALDNQNDRDSSPPSRPAHISQEMFLQWRAPVRGTGNPQRMTNAVWTWLIHSRLNAYQANELFSGPSSMSVGPCWCFDRFGQSSTTLPDGREVLIGGEHEDHYDPDFFIYNDVTVIAAEGSVEIFGYPTDVFPPTDFHSATLLGDRIIVVGSLGYQAARRTGSTQVLTVELDTWRASQIAAEGNGPGWIHSHSARLSEDGNALLITGGRVDDGESLPENIDVWRLTINDWQWKRMTTRGWKSFELRREDNHGLHLWALRQLLWARSVGWKDADRDERLLVDELGTLPNLEIVPQLYRPEVPHDDLGEDDDKYGTYRIRVAGITVRYVEEFSTVQLTIEGKLPHDVVAKLRDDLVSKLAALEQSTIVLRQIR